MAAPIVVELARSTSNASADPDLSQALIDSCSAAAGPGGCVLDGPEPIESRARVVVTFAAAYAWVRVEVLAPITGVEGRSRQITFRDDDPRLERFRAAGLIAAGLVSDVAHSDAAETPTAPPPSERVPTAPGELRGPVALHLGAQSGWNGSRPWAGAALGADFNVAGPAILVLSGSYDQTWMRDSQGISGQRTAIGVGGGIATPLIANRVELRVRIAVDLQQVRASIVQPSTGREDQGHRTATGVETGVDMILPIAAGLDAFCGGRFDWWGGTTTVHVEGAPAETLGAWMASLAAGLDVRF